MRKLWIGLAILIILTPLGLIIPARFGAGSAWGEWSAEELDKMVGYVPGGMSSIAEIWRAPMPDYALRGQEDAPLHTLSFSYVLSGLIGVAVVVALTIILGRLLTRRGNEDAA